jgi:nicotinate phosphoribosyltransferase
VADRPYLDAAYKLVAYAGRDCGKLSPGKLSLPGRKQVFRRYENGLAAGDTIARHDEPLPGEPLLQCVMCGGRRLPAGQVGLAQARANAAAQVARLPAALRDLQPATEPYPVAVSAELQAAQARLIAAHPLGGQ